MITYLNIKRNFKILIILGVLVACKSKTNNNSENRSTESAPVVSKNQVWEQYLKRGSMESGYPVLNMDSNCYIVMDYTNFTYYRNSVMEVSDSMIINGESDSFVVFNLLKNPNIQIGINKIDSVMVYTTQRQADGVPTGDMEFFRRKVATKTESNK